MFGNILEGHAYCVGRNTQVDGSEIAYPHERFTILPLVAGQDDRHLAAISVTVSMSIRSNMFNEFLEDIFYFLCS